MLVKDLIKLLEVMPQDREVVIDSYGITGVIGGSGGQCAKVKNVSRGIDHDSPWVFLHTDPTLYKVKPTKCCKK